MINTNLVFTERNVAFEWLFLFIKFDIKNLQITRIFRNRQQEDLIFLISN
jgi:hypothetical protein